ncbi:MAG: DUF4388 domain-containing protein [Drouetiella hepatica Uher 2000/2452]|jgi:hypothetical protein|uniref:DUF4388 domain-containing protein n=1 Tax=Drouetiella hepatica Uher 2000/2452 TaxID=904376 RepID=A0A951QHL2_9CYAN|nr:DUF4388 domain-containing protein [Drouetiella hepatica Uher 2000/2452]
MAVTGYLAEFSLAELFKFLEQGNKVGLLTICVLADADSKDQKNYYVWFNQGRIVAAGNTLDQQGLLRLISQRGWLGDRAASRLAQSCIISTPMGLCLKSQNVLNAEQLKLLFYAQVMQQVCALFTLKDGWFQFDAKVPLPTAEMTGLNAPATEVTLAGLRALKDWSALADKLPEPTSALVSSISGKPQQRLNQSEWQIWEFVNGAVSLNAIAKQLQLTTEKVQQIAFRLIVSGVVEEMPLVADVPQTTISAASMEPIASQSGAMGQGGATNVSHSFLQNLVGFLRGKA